MCEDAIPGRNCDVQVVSLVSSLSGQLQAWMESLHNIQRDIRWRECKNVEDIWIYMKIYSWYRYKYIVVAECRR